MAPDAKGLTPPTFPIPSSFQLGGTLWTVHESDDITEMGHCDSSKALIRLRSDMPQQVKESTFCHELMHAIVYMAGIPLAEHSERDIDAFGNLLHQFMLTRAD